MIDTHQINASSPSLLRLLFDLVMNPFDNVRGAAAMIVKLISPALVSIPSGSTHDSIISAPNSTFTLQDSILTASRRAEHLMALSGRADHADGYGRLKDILYTCSIQDSQMLLAGSSRPQFIEMVLIGLKHDVDLAKSDLPLAVSSAPIHGRLIALRLIF